jgi:hypothetical protein
MSGIRLLTQAADSTLRSQEVRKTVMSLLLLRIEMCESNQDVQPPQRTRKRQQRSPHAEGVGHSTTIHTK